MLTDYYSAHSSLQKLLFATDENHYRAPLLFKMQRKSDCRFQNPFSTPATQLMHHKCRKITERGMEILELQGF